MKTRLVGVVVIYILIACFVGSTRATWSETLLIPAFMIGSVILLLFAVMMAVTGKVRFWEDFD